MANADCMTHLRNITEVFQDCFNTNQFQTTVLFTGRTPHCSRTKSNLCKASFQWASVYGKDSCTSVKPHLHPVLQTQQPNMTSLLYDAGTFRASGAKKMHIIIKAQISVQRQKPLWRQKNIEEITFTGKHGQNTTAYCSIDSMVQLESAQIRRILLP